MGTRGAVTYWSRDGIVDCAPAVTVLRFSAGAQSTCLLHMYIREELPRPDVFLVTAADPGMEDSRTVEHRERMFVLARAAGIECRLCPGGNLYEDLVNGTCTDTPPYFLSRSRRLRQCCTRAYKVFPLERETRRFLTERFGFHPSSKAVPRHFVAVQLGMTADETDRVSTPRQLYQVLQYPLMDLGMTKADVKRYYVERGLPEPPRSVCQARFANNTKYYADMRRERPDDFAKARRVDEAIRDLSHAGVKGPAFLHKRCVPVDTLADLGDEAEQDYDLGCDSGYCFC